MVKLLSSSKFIYVMCYIIPLFDWPPKFGFREQIATWKYQN